MRLPITLQRASRPDAAGIDVADTAATHALRAQAPQLWMPWSLKFHAAPRHVGGLIPWQRWKFSCLHFVKKNKACMISAYLGEVLPATERPAFGAGLVTP